MCQVRMSIWTTGWDLSRFSSVHPVCHHISTLKLIPTASVILPSFTVHQSSSPLIRSYITSISDKWPLNQFKNTNFFCVAASQRGSWPPHSWGFLDHIQRRTTVGRTPRDEWSARRRDLYLTTHNTHNRQTSMPPVGFEPTISAGERP